MPTSVYFRSKVSTTRAWAPLVPKLGAGLAFVEGHLQIPVTGDWDSPGFARQSQLVLCECREPRLAHWLGSETIGQNDPAPAEDMAGFYAGRLSPVKLVFHRAGEPMAAGVMMLESVLAIAAHYIALGYVGVLRIVARSNYGVRAGVNPHLIQLPGGGTGPVITIIIRSPDEAPETSQIRIDFDDGDQPANTDRLITICTQAQLERFEPEPALSAA